MKTPTETNDNRPEEMTICLRTPCCNRYVKAAPFFRYATDVRHRTCPKCGQRYLVTLKPMGAIMAGAFATEATWLPL